MTDYIILTLIGIAWAFQIFYWAFFMFRVRIRKIDIPDARPSVSVIVCAKNESYNLRSNIPLLMEQKYPDAQIIVVDDCSTDDTLLVLSELRTRYPDLYYTSIPTDTKFTHGKKLAVSVGLKAAKHEKIVFIDADCKPASEHWLTALMEGYTTDKIQLVLGYGRYERCKGLLNLYIRFETFWNAVQYFGFAKAMKPFMGVGRNLSYTKSLYEQSSKFRHHIGILSGDDDLFISEMGKRDNTSIVVKPESQTISEAKHTWRDWFEQKTRHIKTSPLYPMSVKFMLGAELFTRLMMYVLPILALYIFTNIYILIGIGSIIVSRWVVMHIALGIAHKRMGEKGLWWWTIPMDVIVPLIQSTVVIYSTISKRRDIWR